MGILGWILSGYAVLMALAGLLGASLGKVATLARRQEQLERREVLLWGSIPMTGTTIRDAFHQQRRARVRA